MEKWVDLITYINLEGIIIWDDRQHSQIKKIIEIVCEQIVK